MTPNSSFKGKWFAVGFWPVNGTARNPDDELAELRALDPRAGLTNSTLYERMTPVIKNESWVLFVGPFDSRADAQGACVNVNKVLPASCLPGQLDP